MPGAERPVPGRPTTPCVHRKHLQAFRTAVLSSGGEPALADLARRVSPECRQATLDTIVVAEWIPEEYALEWFEGVWTGPAQRKYDTFLSIIDRMMANGFGAVKRFLLSVAGPEEVVKRAGSLWAQEHTTGALHAEMDGTRSAVVVLTDHAYTTTPIARLATAETLRYVIELTGMREVKETHRAAPGELRVRVSWR
jgi:hypothetical protein